MKREKTYANLSDIQKHLGSEPKTTFETARDEAKRGQGCVNDGKSQKLFCEGANWAREFTRTEVLESDELKALVFQLEKQKNYQCKDYCNSSEVHCLACDDVTASLSNFQAKFGSPTEGQE